MDDWRLQARCRGMDPDLFFPEHGGSGNDTRSAKAVCAECPVSHECLDFALHNFDTHDDYGVWGGTSVIERRVLRRRPVSV